MGVVRDLVYQIRYSVDKSSENAAKASAEDVKKKFSEIDKSIRAGITAITSAAVTKVAAQLAESAAMAEETQAEFNRAFVGMENDMTAWARTAADSMHRGREEMQNYMISTNDMVESWEITGAAAAKFDQDIVKLAMDISSYVVGFDDTTTLANLQKAIDGDVASAKELNVTLDSSTQKLAMEKLGLTGTYEALDKASQARVNYTAIMDQYSKALGYATRGEENYIQKQELLNQRLQTLKQMLGTFFLPTFNRVLDFGMKGVDWLIKGIDKIQRFMDKLGGVDRVMNVLIASAAAFAVAMNFSKIISGIKGLISIFGALGSKAALALGVIILIALIIDDLVAFCKGEPSAIGEIFKQAGIDADEMRNKIRSAIDTIKQKWEEFKQAVSGAVENVSQKLGELWTAMKPGVMEDLARAGQDLIMFFQILCNAVDFVIDVFIALADVLAGDFSGAWDAAKSAVQDFGNVLGGIMDWLMGCMETIDGIISKITGGNSLGDILNKWTGGSFGDKWQAVREWLTSGFDESEQVADSKGDELQQSVQENVAKAGDGVEAGAADISTAVEGAFDGVSEAVDSSMSGIPDAVDSNMSQASASAQSNSSEINSSITQNMQQAQTGAQESMDQMNQGMQETMDQMNSAAQSGTATIVATIQSGLEPAWSYIRSIAPQAYSWGADIMSQMASGISANAGAVVAAASSVAAQVKALIHFSKPDTGPLADFDTYMPDMMELMASGIEGGIPRVLASMKSLTKDMSMSLGGIAPNSKTVAMLSDYSNQALGSISQIVNINNTFNGDRAGQEKSSQAMNKATDDSIDNLAHALAYVR